MERNGREMNYQDINAETGVMQSHNLNETSAKNAMI